MELELAGICLVMVIKLGLYPIFKTSILSNTSVYSIYLIVSNSSSNKVSKSFTVKNLLDLTIKLIPISHFKALVTILM